MTDKIKINESDIDEVKSKRLEKWKKLTDKEKKDIFRSMKNHTVSSTRTGGLIDPERTKNKQINALSNHIKNLEERIEKIESKLEWMEWGNNGTI